MFYLRWRCLSNLRHFQSFPSRGTRKQYAVKNIPVPKCAWNARCNCFTKCALKSHVDRFGTSSMKAARENVQSTNYAPWEGAFNSIWMRPTWCAFEPHWILTFLQCTKKSAKKARLMRLCAYVLPGNNRELCDCYCSTLRALRSNSEVKLKKKKEKTTTME